MAKIFKDIKSLINKKGETKMKKDQTKAQETEQEQGRLKTEELADIAKRLSDLLIEPIEELVKKAKEEKKKEKELQGNMRITAVEISTGKKLIDIESDIVIISANDVNKDSTLSACISNCSKSEVLHAVVGAREVLNDLFKDDRKLKGAVEAVEFMRKINL